MNSNQNINIDEKNINEEENNTKKKKSTTQTRVSTVAKARIDKIISEKVAGNSAELIDKLLDLYKKEQEKAKGEVVVKAPTVNINIDDKIKSIVTVLNEISDEVNVKVNTYEQEVLNAVKYNTLKELNERESNVLETVSKMRNESNELRNTLYEKEATIIELENKCELSKVDYKVLLDENKRLTSESKTFGSAISNLEKENKRLEKELKEEKNSTSVMVDYYSRKENEVKLYEKEVAELKQKNEDIETKLQDVTLERNKLEVELSNEINNKDMELKNFLTEIENLKKELETVEELKNIQVKLQKELEDKDKEMLQLTQNYNLEKVALEGKMQALELKTSIVDDLRIMVSTIQADKENANTLINNLKSEKETDNNKIATLEEENKNLKGELEKLKIQTKNKKTSK